MKCLSCDVILTDREATRKYPHIDEYIDLCNNCFVDAGLSWNDKEDMEVYDVGIDKDGELSEL